MKTFVALLVVLVGLVGGLAGVADVAGVADLEAVHLDPVAPGVYRHLTYADLPGIGPYPANGLVVVGDTGVYVVDSAWNEKHGARLIETVERELGKPVKGLVVSHFHDDRIGGAAAFAKREIPIFASDRTLDLAPGLRALGTISFAERHDLSAGENLTLELRFPGAGHSRDNVVVAVPARGVLFGGCLIKAVEHTSLGNVADADLAAWPQTIRSLQHDYPKIQFVVPGHGEAGGPKLLDHTLELLAARQSPEKR